MDTAHLQGFDQLDRKLHELGDKVARDLLVKAVRDGGNVIRDDARQRAPKKSGILAKNIGTRVSRRKRGAVLARIGTTARAWYARLVEYGTSPHEIKVRPKNGKKTLASESQVYGRKVNHPGAAPKPFLRPALETKKEQATQVIGQSLWKGIEDIARKSA